MSSPSDNSRYCPACGAVYAADTQFCPKDGSKVEQSEQIIAGRFSLKGLIGMGNMGTVHRAVQLPMGREVAVKLLHPELVRNPEMVARFEREALAASSVDHPNAITIYDSGRTDDGQVYIAMEYLEGESLSAMLQREGSVSPSRALELWVPIVKAMVVAHRKGVIHRDLKPDNVFISRKVSDEGAIEEVVKVLDFGIAKILEGAPGRPGVKANSKTLAGTRLGTALYMAPEQLEGREAGKHSDVYALGLILIELMTGRLPWGRSADEADTIMTMMRLVTPAKPLRELCPGKTFSSEIQQFLDDVLSIDPARRPQDSGDLLKRVAAIPEGSFLARLSGRRSEISQILSAEMVNNSMRVAVAEVDSAATSSPAASSSVGAGSGAVAAAVRPPEPPTQPLLAAQPSPAAGAAGGQKQLGGMETVKTTVPAALLAALNAGASNSDLPAVPTVVTGDRERPLAAEPTRVKSSPSSDRLAGDVTLPQPRVPPSSVAQPEPAPTLPLLLARLPGDKVKAVASRQESQPTLDMGQWSSNTMRSRRKPAPWVLPVGIGVALLLALLGYLLLRAQSAGTSRQPNTPEPKPAAAAGSPSPPAGVVAAPPPPSAPPGPAPAPTPRTEMVDSSDPAGKHRRPEATEPDSERKGSEVQVTFRVKKPDKATITCGGEPPRACDPSCTVTVGEQCLVRIPGHASKKVTYEEIERRARRGRARIDVSP